MLKLGDSPSGNPQAREKKILTRSHSKLLADVGAQGGRGKTPLVVTLQKEAAKGIDIRTEVVLNFRGKGQSSKNKK